MLGAIIGDIVGSRFEWHNIKTKEFDLFAPACEPTDDSYMTLAVARAILDCDGSAEGLGEAAVRRMREYGRRYPDGGYGGRFTGWLRARDPHPYNSLGNGAAMRVSPCGLAASSPEEVRALSRAVTEVTHNHPEGLSAAETVAMAVYMARTGSELREIRDFVTRSYSPLDFTLDGIRESYSFDVTCGGSVPQALRAFFESDGFEDAIRNAVSIGGDSDTIAAIAGGIAEAYYGVPGRLREQALTFLDPFLTDTLNAFEKRYGVPPEGRH